MPPLRLFFALWPPAELGERLLSAARALAGDEGRAVAAVDLHVTLCFLGAVAPAAIGPLCERVAGIGAHAFELELGELQYWPRSRVLAASCSQVPPAAATLAQALRSNASACGLSPAAQPFAPHVTLLRGASGAGLAHSVPLPAPLPLQARTFHLAQSHALESATATPLRAARYQRLASWPLLESGG